MRYRATAAVDSLIDRMVNDPVDFVQTWSAWALSDSIACETSLRTSKKLALVPQNCLLAV